MRAIVLGLLAVLVLGIAAVAVYVGSAAPLADAPEGAEEPAVARAQPSASSERSSALVPPRGSSDARIAELERTSDALRERLDALESRRVEVQGVVAQRAPIDDEFLAQHRDAIAALVETVLAEREFEREAQKVRGFAGTLARTHGLDAGVLGDDLLLWRRDCFDLTVAACPRGVWPERGTPARLALDGGIRQRTEDLGVLLTARHGELVSRAVVQYARGRSALTEEQQPRR